MDITIPDCRYQKDAIKRSKSNQSEPEPEPAKKKTASKRVVKKKVTLSADDNINSDDPDAALEIAKSISQTEAEKAEAQKESRLTTSSEGTSAKPGVLDEDRTITEDKVVLDRRKQDSEHSDKDKMIAEGWILPLVSTVKDSADVDVSSLLDIPSNKKHPRSNKLDWNNPEGDRYPFDLSKPLPLQGPLGHRTVVAYYFFNNKTSDLEVTYTTSITKRKAARYEIKGIEDMVPTLWSTIKHAYDKDAEKEIKH
ncbi:hypothetical protein Tco_0733301 [Tanacetum coccineum]